VTRLRIVVGVALVGVAVAAWLRAEAYRGGHIVAMQLRYGPDGLEVVDG